MKYESLISFGSKVMAKVMFFFKSKSRSQCQEVKLFGIDRKVLSQGIHLHTIKALSPFVKKLLSRLSLLLSDRRTDRQTDRVIPIYPPPPENLFAGGINIKYCCSLFVTHYSLDL